MAAFSGTIVVVADGDTLTVLRDRTRYRVRLYGIDAPEPGQPFGERARRYAAQFALGKPVTVEPTDRDRRGWLVAEIVLPDGRRLSQEMLRAGYAWRLGPQSQDAELARLEADARAAHRGLWADARPMPPWDWRREKVSRRAVLRRR
jgi:endonuclease YncB( thermonuclease family)